MEFEFSRQIFQKKKSYIEFYKNPSSGIRVVPCGRTEGTTDITKLIVAFRNCANAPKNDPNYMLLWGHDVMMIRQSVDMS
jgi:hypothetical protein